MIRRPPRSTRIDTPLSRHDALPISPSSRRPKAPSSSVSSSSIGPGKGSATFTRSRSEEHTSELQSLMRISYAVFCLKKKKNHKHPISQYTVYPIYLATISQLPQNIKH